jgi:hypothetical protein
MICKAKERAIITLDLWSQREATLLKTKNKIQYKNALTSNLLVAKCFYKIPFDNAIM